MGSPCVWARLRITRALSAGRPSPGWSDHRRYEQHRVERLFEVLQKTIERRKIAFAEAGASTLTEYSDMRRKEMLPRVLVLIDGYEGFSWWFSRMNVGELIYALPRLIATGRSVGVHFAITAQRRDRSPV